MMQDKVDRRAAIQLAMLMLGGAVITISGCGGGGSPAGPSNPTPTPTPAPTPTPGGGDKSGQISANHGHVATLSSAQLTTGMGLSLGIRGSATHNHNITLTDAQVVSVRDGARVQLLSTNDDGHNHNVTFN